MRTAIPTAMLAVTLGLTGCSGPATEDFTRADADAIRKIDADFVAAFNEKAIGKLLSMYTDNSVFMPPNAPTLRGVDPLKSFFADLYAKGAVDLKMDPIDIAGHGPIGYQSGTYSLTTGTTRDRGKFLFVMRKMAGNWRFEYAIWSSDLPK